MLSILSAAFLFWEWHIERMYQRRSGRVEMKMLFGSNIVLNVAPACIAGKQ